MSNFTGFNTGILISHRDQGLSQNLFNFVQVDASGLEHFAPLDPDTLNKLYHSLSVSKVINNNPSDYDRIENYGPLNGTYSLRQSIYLNDTNKNENDRLLRFVDKHFRKIKGYDFNDASNNETNTNWQNMDQTERSLYVENMKKDRMVLVLDASYTNLDNSLINLTMLDIYRDLKADFISNTGDGVEVINNANTNAYINSEIQDFVAPEYLNNASIRMFENTGGIPIIGDETAMKNEIAQKQESITTTIFNTFVEDYFRKMYNDVVEFVKYKHDLDVSSNVIVAAANDTGDSPLTKGKHQKDYWHEDISKCFVTDVSGESRSLQIGDENYIERFLDFLHNGPNSTNNIDSSGSVLEGFALINDGDSDNWISKYIDPRYQMGTDISGGNNSTSDDVKFRSMISLDCIRFDRKTLGQATGHSVEFYGRIGCIDDIFSRLDQRNFLTDTANYLNYKDADASGAFSAGIATGISGENIAKYQDSVHLDISGGLNGDGFMSLPGFGYYCFHPNNVKPGATTSDISSNMNDQMTFFVRSRITTNFKSNSGYLLVNLFNLSNTKVKDISNVIMIDNEGNQVFIAESGGTASSNTGKYASTYNHSVVDTTTAEEYGESAKNRHFSVRRGDRYRKIKHIWPYDEARIEFSQNWMLEVKLNSKVTLS